MINEETEQFPLRAFLRNMKVIQNRSALTVDEYEKDIIMFFHFLSALDSGSDYRKIDIYESDISKIDCERLRKVNRGDILEFMVYCLEVRKDAARTRARKLSSIRSLFKFLTLQGAIKENVAADIETPKLSRTLPKYLSEEECVKLLETIKNDEFNVNRIRDYTIVTLFLNSGMRLSELVGISLTDIDSELRSLRVTGKGAKERIVYLNDASRTAIEAYLHVRKANYDKSDAGPLFISAQHKRIDGNTVQKMIYSYLNKAGLGNRGYSVHKLRHTAATLMYQTGKVDVRVLKDILGHEQLTTTQIYTHVSDDGMKKAMEQNPLSEIKPAK